MKRLRIVEALASEAPEPAVFVQGWVRTRREAKGFFFLELNDGSCLANLQVVVAAGAEGYEALRQANTGAAAAIDGALVPSQGKGQKWELQARGGRILGPAGPDYPLQKKRHSLEFLREIAHLRPRTNLFGAVFRTRSRLAQAIHRFFEERGFFYVHTPIVTASDCEGAGELFRVTALDLQRPPRDEQGGIDFSKDFFGRPTYLTVSGQLEGEALASSLGRIYTFGPTFRAENSNTSRHASEFWMVEPEMAFCDLEQDMDLAESFIREVIASIRESAAEDLALFGKFIDRDLPARLEQIATTPFRRATYTEAIELLQASGRAFEHPPEWGAGLQTEHERYLAEEHFKGPVTICDYPKEIKPFYMRLNDDGRTVAAMDLLAPGIGEIVGGSQREERLDRLRESLRRHGVDEEAYSWYVDLRRYGSVPHAGFGLGFERLLMLVTGVANIRDVVPFPRTPGNADF